MTDQQYQAEHARQCTEVMNYRRAYRDAPSLRVVRPDYKDTREQTRIPTWEYLCLFALLTALLSAVLTPA